MRVAVLGAGYAGLTVARRLERAVPDAVELVVVNDSPSHLVQHELHRLVRFPGLEDAITVDLDILLAEARVIQAEVVDVDTVEGEATLAEADGERTLEYDLAAVCLGAETEFYGLDGVEEHGTPLKQVGHAADIREQALAAPEGTAVVGGGGLSGVQVAGELAEMDETDLDVTLVEMADQIAPGFDKTFAAAIQEELEDRGVTVETGVAIGSATADEVHLEDDRSLPADTLVWAGGIRGPAAFNGARRQTAADLRVSESTFVIGDAAAVTDEDGRAVPASAQTAVREARIAARNIRSLIQDSLDDAETTDDNLDTYRFDSPGWVVSIGDGAVAKVGPVVFSGEPARATKAAVGAGHLGSVGAISQASELVAEELGWPTPPDLGIEFAEKSSKLPTDPASPSEIEYPLSQLCIGVAETFSSGETVDLTGLTDGLDFRNPSGPMGGLDEAMRGLFEQAEEHTGGTTIEVQDESETEDGSDSD